MVEYYGWISISDSTYESDDKALSLVLEKLHVFINEYKINDSLGILKLHQVNEVTQLLVSGCRNHFSQELIDIFRLYEYVAKIAVGSYGLLYIRNDESEYAFNEFEVFVLARGEIKKEKDPFLSPCIPVIEDDEE